MIQITALGHLGADAERRQVGERWYITFRMASTVKRKHGEQTTWISVMYRDNENLLPFLVKGQQVLVMGEADIKMYTKDGRVGVDVSVFASALSLTGKKDAVQVSVQPSENKAAQAKETASAEVRQGAFENDLPF